MEPSTSDSLPQEWLEHQGFVRSLAKSLLADEHRAEDLEQEAWLVTLRNPPRGRAIRTWLRRVVRNLSHDMLRGEGRRETRERAVARPEEVASPEEIAERLALQRRVLKAVFELEEPYRTAIYLRHYEGLPPRRIAERLGLPVKTVKTRLLRAAAILRQRLDREWGGDRRAWCAVLLSLAKFRPATEPAPGASSGSAWPGGISLAPTVVAAVVVAVVSVGLWAGFAGHEDAENGLVSGEQTIVLARGVEERPAESAVLDAAGSRAGRRLVPVEEAEAVGDVPTKNPDGSLAVIQGRLLFSDGMPAAGIALRLQGFRRNTEAVARFGTPASWENPETETDADGRFSLRLDPPRAFQFSLIAHEPGYGELRWRWSEFLPGAREDLGETILHRAGTIVGTVLDERGEPIASGWTLHASERIASGWTLSASERMAARSGIARAAGYRSASTDGTTAQFRLGELEPGTYTLRARFPGAGWQDGPEVEVRPGEESRVDFVYRGPDVSRRVQVTIRVLLLHTCRVSPEHVRLVGAGGEVLHPVMEQGVTRTYTFEDVPPGEYTAEVSDPRFHPWSLGGVRPGANRLSVRLKGNSAVDLTVIDDRTDERLEHYHLALRLEDSDSSPNTFLLLEEREDPPWDRVFDGLVAGNLSLLVSAVGYGEGKAQVADLLPNETRAVVARMRAAGQGNDKARDER